MVVTATQGSLMRKGSKHGNESPMHGQKASAVNTSGFSFISHGRPRECASVAFGREEKPGKASPPVMVCWKTLGPSFL